MSLTTNSQGGTDIIFILQVSELRHREVKQGSVTSLPKVTEPVKSWAEV